MPTPNPPQQAPKQAIKTLAEVLARADTWRGYGAEVSDGVTHILSSGYTALDRQLLHQGWPQQSLVDIAQKYWGGEWALVIPALKKLQQKQGRTALLNPPATPYPVALVKQGIDLDLLYISEPQTPADWASCWRELVKGKAFSAIFAWAHDFNLSYAELRKCQLLAAEHTGLHILFRSWHSQAQNSPANLRLTSAWQQGRLICQITKQKGLIAPQKVALTVPPEYLPVLPCAHHSTNNQQAQRPNHTLTFRGPL